jgi:hypothetical protein
VNDLRNRGVFASASVRRALRNGNFRRALQQSLTDEDYRVSQAIVELLRMEKDVPNVRVLVGGSGLNSAQNSCVSELLYEGRGLPWYAFRVTEDNRARPARTPDTAPQDEFQPFSQAERNALGGDFKPRGAFIFPGALEANTGLTPSAFDEQCQEIFREEQERKRSLRERRERDIRVDPGQAGEENRVTVPTEPPPQATQPGGQQPPSMQPEVPPATTAPVGPSAGTNVVGATPTGDVTTTTTDPDMPPQTLTELANRINQIRPQLRKSTQIENAILRGELESALGIASSQITQPGGPTGVLPSPGGMKAVNLIAQFRNERPDQSPPGGGGQPTNGFDPTGDMRPGPKFLGGIIDFFEDIFGGGGGGSLPPTGPQLPPAPGGPFTPPIAPGGDPGGGDPGGGNVPPIIANLPSGIRNILDNIQDVTQLIENPSVANFLRALDITTANQILDFFGIEGDASQLQQQGGQQPTQPTQPSPPMNGGPPQQGGIMGSLMLELLSDSITSKSGKAILQAMQSGALQGGVFQQPTPVQTPRGVRHYSPPGFVTVDLGGDKISVFRPVAKAMGVYDHGSTSDLQQADKLARKLMSKRKQLKKLAPKLGLKTSNRKSGISR